MISASASAVGSACAMSCTAQATRQQAAGYSRQQPSAALGAHRSLTNRQGLAGSNGAQRGFRASGLGSCGLRKQDCLVQAVKSSHDRWALSATHVSVGNRLGISDSKASVGKPVSAVAANFSYLEATVTTGQGARKFRSFYKKLGRRGGRYCAPAERGAHRVTPTTRAWASAMLLATSMMPTASSMATNVSPKREGRSTKRNEPLRWARAMARQVAERERIGESSSNQRVIAWLLCPPLPLEWGGGAQRAPLGWVRSLVASDDQCVVLLSRTVNSYFESNPTINAEDKP
jgi:hypothetical protein